MSNGLAPRPANEARRAKAVVNTGLIEDPESDLFQIYCDLARDISGFEKASFSLYDSNFQCPISSVGYEEDRSGKKFERDALNVCSYVILDSEPLIMEDMRNHPKWKDHPSLLNDSATFGYAGFPIINKDNYALGTLCILNKEPKLIEDTKVQLIKKITANIALLLDLKIEQQAITAQKLLDAILAFKRFNHNLNIDDLRTFMSLSSDIGVNEENAKKLISLGLCGKSTERTELSELGRELLASMKIRTKPMKKIKMRGVEAEALLDEMFAELK